MRLSDAGSTALTALSQPQTPGAPGGDLWTNILTGASGLLALVNQQKVAKLNIDRAKAGLSPISVGDIPGLTPTVNVGVESGTMGMATLAALGIGALVVLPKLLKKSRR